MTPATAVHPANPRPVVMPALAFAGMLIVIGLEYLGLNQEFGVLKVLRVSTVAAYGTFLVVLASGGWTPAVSSRQGKLLLGLFALAFSSLAYAVVRTYVPPVLRSHIDYFSLFVVAAVTIDRRSRVRTLAAVATVVLIVLALRNVDQLTSGLRVGAFRANVFMGDGNDFAWGLIAFTPFPLYLMLGGHGLALRLLGALGMVTATFAVVGTQSRGATLGVVAAGLYYLVVLSRRRVATIAVIGVLGVFAVAVAPDSYFGRITDTDVAADASAQGRIRAWRAAAHMAIDYPLGVGAGSFNSAYGRYYMEDADDVFSSRRWISAHSIYFKVLGESGFPGLILLLVLLASTFRENQRSRRFALEHPDVAVIDDRWPAALNFGFTGYIVAGAFLGGLTYPHLYLLTGLTVATRRMTSDLATAAVTTSSRTVSPILVGARPGARTPGLVPARQPVSPLVPRKAPSLIVPRRPKPVAAPVARGHR